MKIVIRPEIKSDYLHIKNVNDLAFKQQSEGLLIDKLRDNPMFITDLSLVAVLGNEIIGHILFVPINIVDNAMIHDSLALAPMSVLPKFQGKGIGGQLIKYGLNAAKKLGFESVIVLGHKDYYPKFGFQPASKWNIKAPFDVPDEVFMAIELVNNALVDISGVVEYPPEFAEVE